MVNESQALNINAQWAFDPAIQSTVANQVFVQWDGSPAADATTPDGVYLTFGHVNPPVFSLPTGEKPSPEMLAAFVAPVMPVARIFCTYDRLKAFAAEINQRIAEVEEAAQS